MPKSSKPRVGAITWCDLTVENAPAVRGFYEKVIGWNSEAMDMGGYEDFGMNLPSNGKTVAGICHARGANAGLPPQWLIYLTVADLGASLKACRKLGGKVVAGPRPLSGGRMAVISDPSGAVAALFEPGT